VLFSDDPATGVFTGTPRGTLFMFSTPSYTLLRTTQRAFADVAAFQTGRERFRAPIDGSVELSEIARISGTTSRSSCPRTSGAIAHRRRRSRGRATCRRLTDAF
jgi:hypothetical protein